MVFWLHLAAGLACLGGAMLVWTGLALAFRRLWASRRSSARAFAGGSIAGSESIR
jgi:hypothetical protein